MSMNFAEIRSTTARGLRAAVLLLALSSPLTAQSAGPLRSPGSLYVTSYHGDHATSCAIAGVEFRRALEQRALQRAAAQQSLGVATPESFDEIDDQGAFELNLTGFTQEAEEAFIRAVEIWESALEIKVPVRVEGEFAPDPGNPNTLGFGGPSAFTSGFAGAPDPDIWYPFALANQLAGFVVFPGEPSDIVTGYNSNFSNFYFGLDGNPPSGQFDFVSIVLHELGHGLGMSDSACHNPESSGCPGSPGQGDIGFGGFDNAPGIFDFFLETGDGTRLTSLPSPSAALGSALVSRNLFFGGAQATEGNGGTRVKLYAPGTFDPGSSTAHLDEFTFPEISGDGLMTPFIGFGEVSQEVGPATLGVFVDMGWIGVAEGLLHFAQFGSGGGFSSAVVVQNPSETLPVEGTVTFYDPGGNPLDSNTLVGNDGTFQLSARGSRTFSTDNSGDLVVGSAVVRSNRPVSGVLRFNIDVDALGAAGVGSGLVARAVITPVRREGAVVTGIAIRNVVEDAPITVQLQLFDEDGAAVGNPVQRVILANGRISKFIDEFFGGANVPPGFRGSVIVRVVGEGQMAIIALELGGPGEFVTLPVAAVR